MEKKMEKEKNIFISSGPLEFDYKPDYHDSSYYEDKDTDSNVVCDGFFYIEMFNSFKGEYKDGKRNGEGKEFYKNKKIKFEGEYLDGKRWKGKGYNPDGNL